MLAIAVGSLARRRQRVSHRVEHAPLPLQEYERGERCRVRILGDQVETQGHRPVGSIRDRVHERQPLPLRANSQVQGQLGDVGAAE